MPDNKDLFAPPTKDELNDLFAPPSKEELAGIQGKSVEPSSTDLEAALAGAAQGATFGFSDELGAGADVAGQVLTGKQGLTGLGAKWRELQKQREAANKALQEAHPMSYTGGELAGGLGGAILTPELGIGKALVGGAEALPLVGSAIKAGELTPAALKALGSQAPGLGARIAGKGIAGAIEGAPIGALYGAGSSEADLSKPAELGSDIASGAGMGSLTGAAIAGGIQAGKGSLSKAGEMVSDSDFLRKMGATYGLGKKGIDLSSTRGKDIAAVMTSKGIPNSIVNQIMAVDEQLGQKVGTALQKAQDAGVKINIDPQLEASTKQLFGTFLENPSLMDIIDPKSKKVIEMIYQKGTGDLSPLEARALKDTFYDLTGKLSGLSGDAPNIARMQGTKLAQALDQSLKSQIPEYAQAADQFKQFRTLIPETILEPGVPLDKRTAYLGSLKDKESKLLDATREMFGSAQLPGKAVTGGPRVGLTELQKNLRTLQRTVPEAVKGMGGTAEEVGQNLRNKADMMAAIKQSQGVDPHEGLKKTLIGQVVGGGEGLALNIANKLGRAAKVVGQSAPVQIGTKLFSAADDQLMGLAQKLKVGKGTDFLGNALESALQRKDETAKNAVLFRMMQDPTYRGMLKGEGYSEEDMSQ